MEAGDELAAAEEITSSSIKKQLLALEKAINKNREMRTKFGNDPEKYGRSSPSGIDSTG
jgi:beta-catenin-like protein 1